MTRKFEFWLARLATGLVVTVGLMLPVRAAPLVFGHLSGSNEPTNGTVTQVHGWHCGRAYGIQRHSHRGRSHRHPHWHDHPGSCYHGRRFTHRGTRPSMPMFYYPRNHPRWRWRNGRPRRR